MHVMYPRVPSERARERATELGSLLQWICLEQPSLGRLIVMFSVDLRSSPSYESGLYLQLKHLFSAPSDSHPLISSQRFDEVEFVGSPATVCFPDD